MSTAVQHTNRHYDTIVIGAGMSGLSCAARLHQHQRFRQKNALLVLEGRDRIGGRIGSVRVNGSRLDTGANWIHGIGTEDDPNPLMRVLPHKRYRELAGRVAFRAPPKDHTNVNAEKDATPPAEDWVKVRDAEGRPQASDDERTGDLVIPGDISDAVTGALWAMIGSLHEFAESTEPAKAKNTTMLSAVMQSEELRQGFKTLPEEYHRTLGSMPQSLEGFEAAPLVAQSAEHPEGQAGMSLLEFATDDYDADQVFLQDGYTAVIDEVARDLVDDGKVQCGVRVKQIKWGVKPMAIETDQGTFTADQIICTLPLGVLQQHQVPKEDKTFTASLFHPALPSDEKEAIASVGFGTLDKIFLVFDEAWWNQEPYLSIFQKGLAKDSSEPKMASADSFMGFTDELTGFEIHEDGTVSSGPRTLFLINLHNLTGFPVLSCFVSCQNATQVEAMADEQAAGVVHRALSTWLGIEPPQPTGVHVTRWAQDKFSRGSYSHMITGSTEKRHRGDFQEPVKNKHGCVLRVAGEHTSLNHFATVDGALLSGWREADDILKLETDAAV